MPLALLVGQMVLMALFDTGLSDWPVFLLLLATAQLILWPSCVGVGADGIALGWPWRRRFVGFDAITTVSRFEKGRKAEAGLRIVLASGEELALSFPDERTLAQLEGRIRDAMDAFRERGAAGGGGPFRRATGPVGTTLLRRGEREPAEWVAALRALGAGGEAAGGTATVPRERLFRIVEDPAAEAVDRVAAVVALGGELDAESRWRLRAAAELVAAPRLRVALEMAAEGESEAEGEAALAEVGREEGERRVS